MTAESGLHSDTSSAPTQAAPESLLQEAIRLHRQGDLESARQKYANVLKADPGNPWALQYLGVVSRRQGRPRRAIELMEKSLGQKDDDPGCYLNLARAYFDADQVNKAQETLQTGLSLAPNSAPMWHQQALLYHHKKDYKNAVEAAEKGIACDAKFWDAYLTLGAIHYGHGAMTEAEKIYNDLLLKAPNWAKAHQNYGAVLKAEGRMEEAERAFRSALEINPGIAGAWRAIAEMKKFKPDDPDIPAIESIYHKSAGNAEQRKNVCYALGKIYEDIEQYNRAFAVYQEGSNLHRSSISFDVRKPLRLMRQTRHAFDSRVLDAAAGAGLNEPGPIFILGMPRSGTTLTEQILASHSQVYGGGERYDLSRVVGQARELVGVSGPYPQWLEHLGPAELRTLGRAYLDAVRADVGDTPFFTDKMPANFHYVGLIRMLFPRAKIIHTRRHPADTCLSCFTKLFTDAQDHTYDLSELGRYYRGYEELMAHWRAVLPPGSILEVEYERLVADVQGQTQRLLAYCGLPWEDACLRFFETKRRVATASQIQVRQPIYNSSVQRWRRFRTHLGPLFRGLADGYQESGPE